MTPPDEAAVANPSSSSKYQEHERTPDLITPNDDCGDALVPIAVCFALTADVRVGCSTETTHTTTSVALGRGATIQCLSNELGRLVLL